MDVYLLKARIITSLRICGLALLLGGWCGLPANAGEFVTLSNPYRVEISGLQGTDLEPLFKQVSDTWNYRKTPPPTIALLRMRMQKDKQSFTKLLMSRGYLRAVIDLDISGEPDRLLASVKVTLNEPFLFGGMKISLTNTVGEARPKLPTESDLGLKKGSRAIYKDIPAAEAALVECIRKQGYPWVTVVSQQVVADYASGRMNVYWVLSPGMRAHFGSLTVTGLSRVQMALINKMKTWKPGAIYDPTVVKTFQDLLAGSGLFSVAMLTMEPEGVSEDVVNMKLDVTERPRRSVGFGVGYNTEKGAGVSANWENRNLLGQGECFHFEGEVAEKMTQGEVSYSIPHFFHRGVALKSFSRLGEERPRAYESVYWKNQAGMSWDVSPQLNLGFAYAWKAERVEQFSTTERYLLQSCPASVLWDFRNDRIEPTRGGVLFSEAEYFTEWNKERRFARERMRYRHITKLWNYPQITANGTVGLGLLQGGDVFDIPADERFYAGGSDTIRGYAFQMAGPLLDDDPTGGCSMMTLSGEVSMKVYGPVALIGFLDGGNVFAESTPSTSEELLWGAGGGLRVYTPVGAIGVEVGFPLTPRPVDDHHQYYITIGFQF